LSCLELARSYLDDAGTTNILMMKVFWFFFSKKNRKRFFLQKEAKILLCYPAVRMAMAAAAARFSTPSLL
jgi:hypothetical protein